MKTKAEIAVAFSNGEFEKTNDFLVDDAVWEVVEEDKFFGKTAIMDQCRRVADYFRSVATDFKTLNVIQDQNKVVVNGTAEFSRDFKRVSFVSACDLYEFDGEDKIRKITSYCIQSK
jgi:ketosteroid isomerase-like protein